MQPITKPSHTITIVCGLWNLDDKPAEDLSRFLECNLTMCIYTDPIYEDIIWKHRNRSNTRIFHKKLDDFKTWFEFYPQVQKIDRSIELSKTFLLHDIKIHNPFNSTYFYWIDLGVPIDDKFKNLPFVVNNKFLVCDMLFGGLNTTISNINNLYYGFLKQTLNEKLIDSPNPIFSIITEKFPDLIHIERLDNLLEKLKNCVPHLIPLIDKPFDNIKTHLYVLTYNSPAQFEYLLKSFEKSDDNFLKKPMKFLLNNSTDRKTDQMYDLLCLKYGFEQIKKDNIGICRGRQFVAEHFDQSDADYYIFFEDDMLLHVNEGSCQNGFRKYVTDLYNKTLNIMHKEKYDYLKLN